MAEDGRRCRHPATSDDLIRFVAEAKNAVEKNPDACSLPGYRRGPESLAAIIDEAATHADMPPSAMIRLLDSPTPGLLDHLFTAARNLREQYFGNRVFLYGLICISTHCRNRCSFCYYRHTNIHAVRYRKTPEQVIGYARQLARMGAHLIDLTAGEDPFFFDEDLDRIAPVVDMVRSIKSETGLPVMVSFGPLAGAAMERLRDAGADWFACYQDTFNRQLFDQLRVGQDFATRYYSKVMAKARGMLVEEGILCGIGETSRDILDAFAAMTRIDADQVRAMTFVPQIGTPRQKDVPTSSLRELIVIALMRIAFPHLLIPASLEAGGLAGLRRRLDAGANVVDALIPPGHELAGMISNVLDFDADRPTSGGIGRTLNACGLEPGSIDDYHRWLIQRKQASARVDDNIHAG